MGNNDTIHLMVQIIRSFLKLENDQVVVYNQGWKIPEDRRLYVSVGLLFTKPFGSKRGYEESPNSDALLEVLTLNQQEMFSINVYSYDDDLIEQKDDVLLSFNSTLAQQVMEKYSFKIASLPVSMTDLSALEGASRLYRFQANVAVLRARRKENVVQYYDKYKDPALIINP